MQMRCPFWDCDTQLWVELSGQRRKIGAQTHTTYFQFSHSSIASAKTNTFFLCLVSSCRNNISLVPSSVGDTLFTPVEQPQTDRVQAGSALAIHCLPHHTFPNYLASTFPEVRPPHLGAWGSWALQQHTARPSAQGPPHAMRCATCRRASPPRSIETKSISFHPAMQPRARIRQGCPADCKQR